MQRRSFATTSEISASCTVNASADMTVQRFLTFLEGGSTFCDTPMENICPFICHPGYCVKLSSSRNAGFDRRPWIPSRYKSAVEKPLARKKKRNSGQLLS